MGDRSRQTAPPKKQNWRNLLQTLPSSLLLFFLISPLPIFHLSFFNSPALAQTVKNRKAEGTQLLQQGIQQCQIGQCEVALQFFQQALAVYREIKDRRGEAGALNNLGLTDRYLGNYAKAIEYAQQSLVIAQEIHDRQVEGYALVNLGGAYLEYSNYAKAIEYSQQGLAISREIHNRQNEGIVLSNLGVAYLDQENYANAIEYLKQGLAVSREIHNHRGEGSALGNLGVAYLSQGNYANAIEYEQQHLKIAREIHDRREEGEALGNLGVAYYFLNNFDKAIEYEQQHLAIAQEIHDRRGEGSALGNLGIAYKNQGNDTKAIEYARQALEIAREIGNLQEEAKALGNLGAAYIDLGNNTKVIEYEQQHLATAREIYDRQGESYALGNLGIAYWNLGNGTRAIEYLQQGLAISREIGDRASEGLALNNIGEVLSKQKQPELAIVFYKQSVNIYESIREELKRLPRDVQQSYTNSISSTYRALADLLLSKGDVLEAQQVLELLKVQELREFDRTTRARISSTDKVDLDPIEQGIIDKYGSYITFNQKLDECEHQKPACADYDKLNKLWKANKAEYDRAVAVLEADVKQRKNQDEQNVLDPKNELSRKAADILKDNKTALVYFFVTDQRIWIILATKGEVLRRFEVGVDRKTLSTQVIAFRQLMEACQYKTCTAADTEQFKVVSQKLYGWLFPGPLQKEVQGRIQHLVFSLDRNLRYIPMSALYDGKHYLIEDYAISTIASAQFNYTDPFQDGDSSVSVLAAGFSDTFPPDFPRPLTNVPVELNAIVQAPNQKQSGIYPSTILLNQTFKLDNLQKDLVVNRILHIATHGEFLPLGQGGPYILSGDKHKININQIGDLRGIGNLKLVVLSACQTALGKEGQDGVEINSLGFSFLSKGAKSVMASLWNVSDISTSLLMQQFYQNLAKKPAVTRAEALRQAQLRFVRGELTVTDGDRLRARADQTAPPPTPAKGGNLNPDFQHPYYWSPFVLIGSGF